MPGVFSGKTSQGAADYKPKRTYQHGPVPKKHKGDRRRSDLIILEGTMRKDKIFEPHPLVRGGQLQTLLAFLYHGAKELARDELLTLEVSKGDQLRLDINHPPAAPAGTPVVYLMHGLGGNSESAYKLRIARKLLQFGYRTVRHNHRGCAPETERAQGIYHSGSVEDVLAGVRAIAAKWPESPLLLVGFSLSGTILLNLLGSRHADLSQLPQIKAALSVCAPLDLHASSEALCHWSNRHYDIFYTRILIARLLHLGIIDSDRARDSLKSQNLRQFDELITAPLGGFESLKHYYDSCSPIRTMANIDRPTTILAAADDPIVPLESVQNVPSNPFVSMSLQTSGGHIGFISRQLTSFGDRRWVDEFVVKWAQDHCPLRLEK